MFQKLIPLPLIAALLLSTAARAARECEWNKAYVDPGSSSLILQKFRSNALMDIGYCIPEPDPDREEFCRHSVVVGTSGTNDEYIGSDKDLGPGYSDKFLLTELGTSIEAVGHASFVIRRYRFSNGPDAYLDFKVEQSGVNRHMSIVVGNGLSAADPAIETQVLTAGTSVAINFEPGDSFRNALYVSVDKPGSPVSIYKLLLPSAARLTSVSQGRMSINGQMPAAALGQPNLVTIDNMDGKPFVKPK